MGLFNLIGGLIGGKKQRKSAKKAAAAIAAAMEQNNALSREFRDRDEANFAPFVTQGGVAGRNAMAALGFTPGIGDGVPQGGATPESAFEAFKNSTGYNFRRDEGLRALESSFRAGGMSRSGMADRNVMRYADNLAASEYAPWYDRLADQQRLGLGAASNLAGINANHVANVSNNTATAAGAKANSYLARGNISANLYGQAGAFAQSVADGPIKSIFSKFAGI